MRAERERREAILQAEGKKTAAILNAEGDKESMILRATAEKEAAIAKAEGEAEALRLVYEAQAKGINYQGSVASSRILRILELIISLEVSVSSNSRSPIIFLNVVAVKFSIALIGRSTL